MIELILFKGEITKKNKVVIPYNEKYERYLNKTSFRVRNNILRTKAHPIYKRIRQRLYLCGKKHLDPIYLKRIDKEFVHNMYYLHGKEIHTELSYYDCLAICRKIYQAGYRAIVKKKKTYSIIFLDEPLLTKDDETVRTI